MKIDNSNLGVSFPSAGQVLVAMRPQPP